MDAIHTLDLEFYGTTRLIASFLVPVDAGFVVFDPGPASAVPAIERRVQELGFELEDLRAVFATHVHLDHAGGAGVLAQRTGCAVHCHPIGAPHLVDPAAKLLPSAERLYGEMMVPLWGNTVEVPQEQIRVAHDGEAVMIGDFEVIGWHTPGHAIHHVAWQIGDSVATGDVAGVRFPGSTHVLPPMPPPDIDVKQWRSSLDLLRRLEPKRLLLTHFGAFEDTSRHIDELDDRLLRWTEVARRVALNGGGAEDLGRELKRIDEDEMKTSEVAAETAERYRRLCPVKESSTGLFRYCSLKEQRC
jgi:glyoxylase-like metal-dependent hydrolase (beta-lactamase superfamily II)